MPLPCVVMAFFSVLVIAHFLALLSKTDACAAHPDAQRPGRLAMRQRHPAERNGRYKCMGGANKIAHAPPQTVGQGERR